MKKDVEVSNNTGTMSDESLVMATVRETFRMLNFMQKENPGKDFSKDYFKALVFAAKARKKAFQKKLDQNKKDGWVIEKDTHIWCGDLYHEFSIPSIGIYKSA